MLSVLGFLAVLGPLVIVHEFGHYIFARIFGVKAEVFSIGFGPVVWRKQLGETELRVSAVPLGGFVKLLGEEPDVQLPPELVERALQRKAPWKRFFIFFGGPLFNFIFAILVFMSILVIGEPQMASVLGRVVDGSPAAKAGLQSGDRVTAINGEPVKKFEEVLMAIHESPEKPLRFDVIHPGATAPTQIEVTPTPQQGFSVYGEATSVGEVQGLLPAPRSNQLGVSQPESQAAKAGLKTGDRVVSLNSQPIKTWEELDRAYAALAPGSEVALKLERGDKKIENLEANWKKPRSQSTLGSAFGLHSSEMFIDKTIEGSPAEKAGVKAGDRLISVAGHEVASFFDLKDAVQRAGEQHGKVMLAWERAGALMTAEINPSSTTQRDAALKKTTQFTVGIVPMLVWVEPVMIMERVWNPLTLLYKATERTVVFSYRNFVSLGKMFTGDVSIGTLGGPILIGKIAGESISRGLIAFLTTMAVLSVGLGVLNILPIPVLDGGHLLLLGIEAVRGKPLTIRQTEIIQQVGLSLILLLMVVVMRNDLSRLPFFD